MKDASIFNLYNKPLSVVSFAFNNTAWSRYKKAPGLDNKSHFFTLANIEQKNVCSSFSSKIFIDKSKTRLQGLFCVVAVKRYFAKKSGVAIVLKILIKQYMAMSVQTLEQLWKFLEFLIWSHQAPSDFPRLFEWLRELASAGRGFAKTFIENQPKGACGRQIIPGEGVYTCKTCQTHPSAIICIDCFENSNHVGHEIMFHQISSNGATCDCGDVFCFSPTGFCNDIQYVVYMHACLIAKKKLIELDSDVRVACRLVCGYMIFLLSHAFSGDHHDVVYLPPTMVRYSSYFTIFNTFKHKIDNTRSFEQFTLLLLQLTKTQDKILTVYDDNIASFPNCLFVYNKQKKKKNVIFIQRALQCAPNDALDFAWRLQMFGKMCSAVAPDSIIQTSQTV
ncbi:hypothetical protein RFI_27084 [Reticulomyxa filosa]|uniref:E3 ubiquitin-protein ligase n=1 Tax=Reticulomyxa filosa TaxID=46433 RepID=X6M9Y8_RETFI|nr:hypothetical protein RFI_27084 [Reticulomyxa filosa]|eukprot:ETO10292.1 hypothetical protein RFI_27084 [Reticulomyxa filosa]